MIEVRRQALVMYSAQEMFDVVNDIAAYPDFIANCRSTKVTELANGKVLGELVLSKAGFDVTFCTENTLTPPNCIDLLLQSGPLKSLTGRWTFNVLSQHACEIEFVLRFQTKGLLRLLLYAYHFL